MSGNSLKSGQAFTHKYLLCAERDSQEVPWWRCSASRSLEQWRPRLLASAPEDGIWSKFQQHLKFLHALSESERASLQMWWERLKWKLLHQNTSFGGGGRRALLGKIFFFFLKEQREVDERIWGYNDQSLHCLLPLPHSSSKHREKK